MKKIKWNVSGGFIYNQQLIDFNKTLKNFYGVNENFINTVFDSSYGMAWNGGRISSPRHFWNIPEMQSLIENLNNENIGFNYTFSQPNLDEQDLEDKNCNKVLTILNQNEKNGIVFTNDLLGTYVRENYPNIKLIYSACNNIQNIEEYEKAALVNDIVVVSPDFNKDFDYLNQLKNKEKFEIIANEPCGIKCPYRNAHYKKIGEYNKNSVKNLEHDVEPLGHFDLCLARHKGMIMNGYNNTNAIDPQYLTNYTDIGFTNFKLVGREWSFDMILNDLKNYIEKSWVQKLARGVYEY